MQIAYVSFSQLPSQKANAVQVMGMCAAFALLGHSVTLYARPNPHARVRTTHRGPASKEVYAYYGVPERFDIIWAGSRLSGHLGRALDGWHIARAVRRRRLPGQAHAEVRERYTMDRRAQRVLAGLA
jgi:hypothetical protein